MEARSNEQSPLTDPKILLEDNASKEAQGHIVGYQAAKAGNSLTEFDGCSDARANIGPLVPREDIIFRPSIAAAGDKSAFKHVIAHPATRQFITLQHFDSSTVTTDEPPMGCGGLGVKKQRVEKNEQPAASGILGFVDRIHHPGIYNQSYREALALAQYTDKPILAGALDHLTGLIHPFIVFADKGKTMIASVPFGKFNDPSYIYRNGIPDLPDAQIPPTLLEILLSNRRQVKSLATRYPDLAETQKIQDPAAIILTTSLLPTNLRYPHIFGQLNTNFGIEMPIVKKNGEIIGINERAFKTDVLAQLEYPIGNAIQAQSGHGGHGFRETHRLIIETPEIGLSRKIGRTVRSQPWMTPWLGLHGNEVWVAQVVSGRTQVAEVLR